MLHGDVYHRKSFAVGVVWRGNSPLPQHETVKITNGCNMYVEDPSDSNIDGEH